MAAVISQPKFSRHLSTGIFIALTLLVWALLAPATTQAEDGNTTVTRLEPSYYGLAKGEPFFLLSDAAYGHNEPAFVRLETPNPSSLESYGGVDVVLYRIPKPLAFLKSQKNLHRIDVAGNYAGEGLSNTLTHLIDSWLKKSRMAWQKLFSARARNAVTGQVPQLRTPSNFGGPSEYRQQRQYKPLTGLTLISQFRYPVNAAKPIEPPKEVKLLGSSSEFITPQTGNVHIPLGILSPGLYLVEAMVGEHRATTLVFVSDTLAITKNASQQMVVWTVNRQTGLPVSHVDMVWTDGTGLLKSGTSDSNGLTTLNHDSPEQTYLFGADPAGGVFISENFYFDSEIYNAKLYAVTDRPLYRPGDQVFIKINGRKFTSARTSQALTATEMRMEVLDPNGLPVTSQTVKLASESGADTSFQLPDNAHAGGYEIRFDYQGDSYTAAFRVAEYQKPHFDIGLIPGKPHFKTGEAVYGSLQLRYPDGKPVEAAKVQLSVRAQQLNMVEGELQYSGQFPVKLTSEAFVANSEGIVTFKLPAAKQPSRYVLSALATDGAAYRVKMTRELLVERSSASYSLHANHQFSAPGDIVRFQLGARSGEVRHTPATWEWVRLEDQSKASGKMPASNQLSIQFSKSGSYMLTIKDGEDNIVAGTSHWVSGAGLRVPAGNIEIVLDKPKYKPGETAEALVTFPEPVQQALLTLERDKVEQTAMLTKGGAWVSAVPVGAQKKGQGVAQWRLRIPVSEALAPNMTLSVAYAKHGQYVFENSGLRVEQTAIDIQFSMPKEVYVPGETVEVTVRTRVQGKPASALLSVGVVDEMIYVLQPEIAPSIEDFFYHPRRNNVRTSSSLSFVSYDLASGRSGAMPARHEVNDRSVKVLERPRRDNVDTAFWQPVLRTDASGYAVFRFTMPDSLTRWRLTGRAMNSVGLVGQKTAYVRSDKAFYAKWTSPDWMRKGDVPTASIALFNQTQTAQTVSLLAQGAISPYKWTQALKPGANFIPLTLSKVDTRLPLTLTLSHHGNVVDRLQIPLHQRAAQWQHAHSLLLPITGENTALRLPADARQVQVQLVSNVAAQFGRVMNDLIEYPYGCVEQTASRLIPLGMAYQSLMPDQVSLKARLAQQLYTQRIRLAHMAGPQAHFGWWGAMTQDDPLLTVYAYYADWHTSQALQLQLPAEHWERLLKVYASDDYEPDSIQRALMLWMMQQMGLPVRSLLEGALDRLPQLTDAQRPENNFQRSLLMANDSSLQAQAFSVVLLTHTARQMQVKIPTETSALEAKALDILHTDNLPLTRALLVMTQKIPAESAGAILADVRAEMPTFDRALTVSFLHIAMGGYRNVNTHSITLTSPWQPVTQATGQTGYVWPESSPLPDSLSVSGKADNLVAVVHYLSATQQSNPLPLTVSRKLYKLEPHAQGYVPLLVKANQTLEADALYLDEVSLRPTQANPLRYGLLEVALPPGASVDSTTWGMQLQGDGAKYAPLEKARHESTDFGYAVPLDILHEPVVLRHLVRFSQKGSYNIPLTRFYQMYQPEQKAAETGASTWHRMEVQ